MKDEIKEYILSVLINEFNLPIERETVTDKTELGPSGLNLESLTFVELAFRLEDKYGISIPEDDYDKIATFTTGALVDYLDHLRPGREASA